MLSYPQISLPTGFGIATYPAGATFGPRAMRDFEFVWIIAGDVEYRWSDQVVAAPAGAIVLCRPGATDFFRWDPAHRTRHGYFHFDILSLPDEWPAPHTWPLVRLPEAEDIVRPLFRHILNRGSRAEAWQRRLVIATMLAAFVSGDIATGDVPQDTLPQPVERALSYLQARLENEPDAHIELGELAEAACVTSEHLCRLFKTATGYSPVETVRLARLDHAAVLLARSNYSVGEIAKLCGFASPFHFSRCFKAVFGQAPRDLRKAIQAGATPPTPRLMRRMRDEA